MSAQVGTVVSLFRYPVKSMLGEELNASAIDERGLRGDRAYAFVDTETRKVVSAKEPRKWARMFDCRAAFAEPVDGGALPAVRITLPDGTVLTSGRDELDGALSELLARPVVFASQAPEEPSLEEYWPDMEGLDHRDTITDEPMPPGTFFDAASVHVLTSATLDALRLAYPEGRFEPRRFRPNLIVQTDGEGFVENDWVGRELALGDGVRLKVVKPCPRCVMTTLPQGDLPKDPGILRAAAQNNGADVGVYASVVASGTVRRGDPVVLE